MPESAEGERGGSRRGSATRATPNSVSQSNVKAQLEANRKRIGSAKYYDIASTLMGKGHAGDLEEIFLAAARDGDYDRIEDFMLRSGKDHLVSIDVKDKRTGNTALIWAAKRGHIKIVQLLLKHGADITLRNYEGQTAVEVASTAIKNLLLDSVDRSTESSHRLLLQAAWQGNIKVLRKLLYENKVKDINCRNADGLTPLLLVARDIHLFERLSTQQNRAYNPAETVTTLLAHRADIHAVDEDGKTCLHYASQSKATLAQTIVQALITGGPDIDLQDKRLFAPIHCASQIGNVECLEVLINGGSKVNSRGFAGTTPLHLTAYNDHEKAACCLLKHGADVKLTDDRGLTPLDLARGRKMKNTLKEAWTDAHQNQSSTNLAPIKAPNRDETRSSLEDLSKRKKGGEVIYDNMPANPFLNMKNTPSKGRLLSRHLSLKDKDKARRAEENMRKDMENGNFTPGPYMKDGVRRLGLTRNQQPSPIPKGKGYQRLPAISPDRLSSDRNLESPIPFNRNSRFRRSLDETRLSYSRNSSNLATFPVPGGSNKRISPILTKDGRLTPLSFDFDSGMGNSRLTPSSPTPSMKHRRSGSDTLPSCPNLGELAASCDPYLNHKTGRSVSVCSKPLSHSDDYGDTCLNSPRLTPLERETTASIHFKQSEGCALQSNTLVLNLDRMGLTNKCQTPVQNAPLFPTSSKVLPPTPTMLGEKAHSCLESRMTNNDGELSKESSPRSDDEVEKGHKNVKLAFQNSSNLLRSPSIFKEEFILEESRPKDILIHSSGSDLSSTGSKDRSSISSDEMLPPDMAKPVAKQKNSNKVVNKKSNNVPKTEAKLTDSTSASCSVVSVNAQNRLVSNLRMVGSKRSSVPGTNTKTNVPLNQGQQEQTGKGTKDKVTVHSQKLGASAVFPNEKTANAPSDHVIKQNILNTKASAKSKEDEKCANKDKSRRGCSPQSVEDQRGVSTPNSNGSSMQVVSTKLLANVREEIKKTKLEKGDFRAASRASGSSLGKENINQNETNGTSVSSKNILTAGQQKASRSPAHSPARRPASEIQQTGSGSKGNNANPTPSYLLPTQSSVTRKQNPEVSVTKSQSQPRNTGVTTENTRKSASSISSNKVTNQAKYGKNNPVIPSVSKPKADAKTSAAFQQKTPSSQTSSSSSSQSVTQASSVTSRGGNQISGVRKSQSDTNVPQDSKSSVANSTAMAARTRSSSDNSAASYRKKPSESANVDSSAKLPSNLKSSSATKMEGTSNVIDSRSQSTSNTNPTTTQSSKQDQESDKKLFQYKPASAGKPPLVEIVPEGTPRTSKQKFVESKVTVPVQTPVIVNPFEDMKPYKTELEEAAAAAGKGKVNGKGVSATAYGYTIGKPSYERSKTQTSVKSRAKSAKRQQGKESKPGSGGPNRQGGGRRRGAKSKDSKNSDESAGGRPKSGKNKGTKSGKKRKRHEEDDAAVLSKQAAQSDVALISGIGWHLATTCMDTSDVKAVRTTGSDSSDFSDDDSIEETTPRQGLLYQLRIPNLPLEQASNASTPRFLEVKPEVDTKAGLPVMSHDGYRPMNLDMTQASLPPAFNVYNILSKENPQATLPSNFNSLFHKMDGSVIEPPDVLPEEQDDVAAEIQRNILMGKLTPIPESPSLKSNHILHKTLEAIEKFDHDVQVEALNNLLGLVRGGSNEPSPRVDLMQSAKNRNLIESSPKQPGSATFSNSAKSGRQSNLDRSAPSSSKERAVVTSGASVRSSRHSMEDRSAVSSSKDRHALASGTSVRSSRNGLEDRSVRSSSKERVTVASGTSVRSSLHNSIHDTGDKSAPSSSSTRRNSGLSSSVHGDSSVKRNSVQSDRNSGSQPPSRKSSSKYEITESRQFSGSKKNVPLKEPQAVENVQIELMDSDQKTQTGYFKIPKLENMSDLEHSDDDLGNTIGQNKSEGRSTRRERKFSETKSEDKNDDKNDKDNIEEVIEEILSNTIPSASSTLKSHKSPKGGVKSLSSTFSEADAHVLKKLTSAAKDSPFHAKVSQYDSVKHSGSYDDLSVPHPTNPNLLNVFHAENFQLGQKVKAMIDAGAGSKKVKAMADADNEAKQIAKIMNSFKHMELYAGSARLPTSREIIPKPETSSMEPTPGRKPPSGLTRPNSAGAGKVRSAGRFTEIKNEKNMSASREKPLRQTTSQRVSQDDRVISTRASADPHNLHGNNSSYIPVDAVEQELVNAMRAVTPENDTIVSFLSGSRDAPSRSGSACTTISTQSSVEETIQWKKGNVLGKGAFGTVWCGLTSEGQLIAVKQIELNTVDNDKAKREYEKVQEEVELLKTLNHKNIVGYLGTSLEENIVSIFMQFVPGGSIASILARFGALDEAVFRRYTKQVLEGVRYLHSNDVIHRDIKGGNVMLMPNGIIKLIDFGCAKRLCINLSMGQSQILKSMKGTPFWMAPEVVNETGHGKKSDIWSVGCTVFEMATRKPPWADMNPMAAIFAIGSDKPVPQLPNKFSADAISFVNACLTRDQNKRLSATQLLQHVFINKRKNSKK